MFEKITQHLVQYFAKLKNMQNIFFMKNGFIIWEGDGPRGPGQAQSACPPYDESIFDEKNIVCMFFNLQNIELNVV